MNHAVAMLSPLTPGVARAVQVRALCRARLERDRRRSKRLATLTRFGQYVVAPAIAAGLFALYAAHVVSITLRTLTASW
jgi:hypothetical protein